MFALFLPNDGPESFPLFLKKLISSSICSCSDVRKADYASRVGTRTQYSKEKFKK